MFLTKPQAKTQMTQWNPIIISHTVAAFGAAILGIFMFLRRKGDSRHVITGRTWAALLMFTAVSSFFIKTSGSFSFIHLLSIFTPLALVNAVIQARKGNIRGHKRSMISLYVGSIVIAGLFTFAPGRLLNRSLMSIINA